MTNSLGLPKVSIITVNFNQPKVTCELLDSLKKISYPNYEIIVVDNGSKDGLENIIPNNYPEVQYIKSKTNLGFAGGNNLGIGQSQGDYILLLNNDVEVPKGFLEPMVNLIESDSNVGMVSPKIKFFDPPHLIQYAGATAFNKFTSRNKKLGLKEKDNGQYDSTSETSYSHGAALLISKKVVNKIGYIPECYFLYYEELDWCERVKSEGYKIMYIGTSTIYHKESQSIGKATPLKTYYMTRNRLLFVRRNFNNIQKIGSFAFYLTITIPVSIYRFLKNNEWDLFKPFFKGIFWHIQNPKLDKKSISLLSTPPQKIQIKT